MYTPKVLPLLLLIVTVMLTVGTALLRGRPVHRAVKVCALVGLILCAVAFCVAAGSYELRKLAGACAMPTGLLWLALITSAVVNTNHGRRAVAVAAWCLWLAYSAAGNVWVAQTLMAALENEHRATDPFDLPKMDAVLVLGGGIAIHDYDQLCLGDSGDRVLLAARLHLAGRARVLVPAGPFWPPKNPRTSGPEMSSRIWQELGVPDYQIVLLEGPRTTGEEVRAFAHLAEEQGWQRMGLLTSAWHLRRALRLCERHGLQMIAVPADFRSTTLSPRPVDLVPQGPAFATIHRAAWEYLGAALGQ